MLKAVFMVVLAALLGCSGPYGRIAVNADVKKQFESYNVLPDHRYYYSGSFARPRAVIGIHKDYTLQSRFWIPVDLTPEQLKRWVDYFGPTTQSFRNANGSEILTEGGQKIGVWYAFRNWKDWATVKMIDDHVVNISTPIFKERKGIVSGIFTANSKSTH